LLKENKLEFPDQIQGDNNLFKVLDEDGKLCNFLSVYFKQQITA